MKYPEPTISIILCVYNGQDYIVDCLRSISNQTYNDFEVIIIDDGSTDNSSMLIDHYLSENSLQAKIIKQSNRGLTYSLNKAIELATGVYIARMDADDVSLPNRLEESKFFLENNSLDFISTKSERFSENKELTSVPKIKSSFTDFNGDILKFGNPFVHGTFFFKRSIADDIRYDEKYRTAQDYDFIIRICKSDKYKVGYLNKALYRLRVDENSSGRKSNSTQLSNARHIATQHFGTDRYLIPRYKGLNRMLLSVWKRLAYER